MEEVPTALQTILNNSPLIIFASLFLAMIIAFWLRLFSSTAEEEGNEEIDALSFDKATEKEINKIKKLQNERL